MNSFAKINHDKTLFILAFLLVFVAKKIKIKSIEKNSIKWLIRSRGKFDAITRFQLEYNKLNLFIILLHMEQLVNQ